jgi:hypothetical protein
MQIGLDNIQQKNNIYEPIPRSTYSSSNQNVASRIIAGPTFFSFCVEGFFEELDTFLSHP